MNIYRAPDQNDTRSDWWPERHVLNITKEREHDLPSGRKGVVFASPATSPNDPVFFFLGFKSLFFFYLETRGLLSASFSCKFWERGEIGGVFETL